MPSKLKRIYGTPFLHFITVSCYQRKPALGEAHHRNIFVKALSRFRDQYGFSLVGYVVMPEHVHLLISEPQKGNPSVVMQSLKQTVSREILKILRSGRPGSHAQRLLVSLTPPRGTGNPQFWQRRFYDFNVWSGKKMYEKLEYMHMNPVKRGLVQHPAHWPWSSFRFYAYGDAPILAMDRWPPKID